MKILLRILALSAALLVVPLACGGGSTEDPSSQSKICESDTDCSQTEAPFCDGFQGCVACVLDAHCVAGQACEDNTCVTPQACSVSSDCTDEDKPVCNWVLEECAQCVFAGDCGENAICDQGTCVAVTGCINSLDCPKDTVCDRDLSYCVECISDGDCEETHTCVANECIQRCTSDKACTGAGELCNRDEGYCVECVEHEDCPALYHCSSGSCDVDVCLAGHSSCVENLNAIELCNPAGEGTAVTGCAYGSTCVEEDDAAACVSWTCSPGAAVCDSKNKRLMICDEDGLGATLSNDCTEAGGVCENSACVDVFCEAKEVFCLGSGVYQCNELGTSYTSINVCSPSYHCDAEAGGCALNTCNPNAKSCDGNVLKTCNETGSGFNSDDAVDCTEEGEVCWSGACRAKLCEPNENYCLSGSVFGCYDNGSRTQIYDYCTSQESCETGTCKAKICTPSALACDGEWTGTCSATGLTVDTSEGDDCSQLEESACWNGECSPTICDPNKGLFCAENARYTCTQNGTAKSLYSTCSAASYCDDATGSATCKSKVCTPNSPACDGNRTTTCNAMGSGYSSTGTDCEDDEKCVGGSCLPIICTANAYYCKDGHVQRCGPDGTTTSVQDTCGGGEFCEEGTGYCKADTCTADQPTCDGALVATCAANGSGPLDDGVACPEGKTCDGGACLDVFCVTGEQYCEDNYRRTCNQTGTGYSGSTTCSTIYYCSQETSSTTACRQDICGASSATCDGEVLATCAPDGGSYTDQSTDCSLSDQLCTGTGCATSVTEAVGGTTYNTSNYCNGYRLGNRYEFGSSRKLTEIKQYLHVAGTIQLTWVIYETSGASIDGSYTKVYEKITTSSGNDYHSSGAIDFDVVPGKIYVIGVRPNGSCSAYYGGTSGKAYLSSSGYVYYREYESNSGTLWSTWTFSGYTYAYAQELKFE